MTHKLILLVLVLILACLAVLVGRTFQPEPRRVSRQDVELGAADASPPLAEAEGVRAGETQSSTAANRSALRGPSPVPSAPSVTRNNLSTGEGGRPDSEPASDASAGRVVQTVVNGIVAESPGTRAGLAGEVWGRVTMSGTPPRETPIDFGPSCGPHQPELRTTRHYILSPEGGLGNVLVFLHPTIEVQSDSLKTAQVHLAQPLPAAFTRTGSPLLLDQIGCMFEPYVGALQLGGVLRVRNSDPLLHNVHLTPKLQRERNFAQPVQGKFNDLRFDRAEPFIRIKCDVHPWMFAYISVVPHPYFAVTDSDGNYRLPGGLPPGRYGLSVHHLRASSAVKAVDLREGQEQSVDFELNVSPSAVRQGREVSAVPQ